MGISRALINLAGARHHEIAVSTRYDKPLMSLRLSN
jgi:hypothetical protein